MAPSEYVFTAVDMLYKAWSVIDNPAPIGGYSAPDGARLRRRTNGERLASTGEEERVWFSLYMLLWRSPLHLLR
jgi:hypothetical protein